MYALCFFLPVLRGAGAFRFFTPPIPGCCFLLAVLDVLGLASWYGEGELGRLKGRFQLADTYVYRVSRQGVVVAVVVFFYLGRTGVMRVRL